MGHTQTREQMRRQPARSEAGWRSELGRAQRSRLYLMPQLQTQVPHPLAYDTPGLLIPGRVRTPPIRFLLLVLIGRLGPESSPVQVQLDDIGGGERLLRQIGEEEFVDDARTRDANRALLLAG